MIRLREKDINKLSTILKYPTSTLQELVFKKLLNEVEAFNLLVRHDWKKMKRSKKYTTSKIVEALMEEYQFSKSKIENAIYEKRKLIYWCGQCEKRIPKTEYKKNDGICEKCVTNQIKSQL